MKLSTLMYLGGAASILLSLANYVQGKQLPAGEQKNDKQHDGNFIGHWAPSFFILGKIFEDHEKA
ncbi:hypothetical protein [Deinococcus altitudinis]|uniref:hypothetical protein n=1 Tax=Deinococcus altitudinis TaxID=468914 RepID=UPI0038925012